MPLTTIPDYAPLDIIPSSWANTLKSNQGKLDARTGGDPTVPGQLLVALSTTGGQWRVLQAGDFSPGIISDAAMANQKVNRVGDTMTGDLTVSRAATSLPGHGVLLLGQTGGLVYIYYNGSIMQLVGAPVSIPNSLALGGALSIAAPGAAISSFEFGKTGAVDSPFLDWHSSGTGSDYDVRMIANGGNAAAGQGQLSMALGTLNLGAATLLAGIANLTALNVVGSAGNPQVIFRQTGAASTYVLGVRNNSDTAWMLLLRELDGLLLGVPLNVGTIGGVTSLNGGTPWTSANLTPTPTPTPNAIPQAGADGKIAAGWLPASSISGVPSGMIAYHQTGAPAGWTLVTIWDGLFVRVTSSGGLVNTGGGAASHDHGFSLTHAGGAVAGEGASPVKVNVVTPGDANASPSGHGHNFTNPSAHTVATPAASNLPPFVYLYMIVKS